jgi:hypothetical protein
MNMDRIVPIITIALIASSCGAGGGRSIDLSIDGGGGQMAYFDRFENNRPVHVDSVKLAAAKAPSASPPYLSTFTASPWGRSS